MYNDDVITTSRTTVINETRNRRRYVDKTPVESGLNDFCSRTVREKKKFIVADMIKMNLNILKLCRSEFQNKISLNIDGRQVGIYVQDAPKAIFPKFNGVSGESEVMT